MARADVVVVGLGLDPGRLARCAGVLDPEETDRAGRFLRAADRARFLASHAALRAVVGAALGRPAASLRFGRDADGRPFLAEPAGTGLDINLSHSGGVALVGLVRSARIGVDVEVRRPLPDALRIARGHFAQDEACALEALPPEAREAAFFALWTRKEAVVKALGAGLSLPLAAFSVSVPPAPPRMLRIAGEAAGWTLAAIEAGPGVCATAAVPAAGCTIRTTALPAGWADEFDAK
ncbi:4'-phosphopantetheinyl transferase family protein [Methylobacterium sp. J-076]|uniref:4'-phosphopantetheinyl transferase family protein n=1 Tax=Methylobacterium sp. J-076 TaxID=2836655 RepID=UPI001FBA851D|nr:4'-phosphopantetheinyl transferase superfamily protein [Methylobacterium sp. J-076]MCJ2013720.1 4'-phosphopantetheinyl transferase superfamily protein [Methylobacterium sp. J-076]